MSGRIALVVVAAAILAACQATSAPTVRNVEVNDVSLRYLEQGRGDTVVLVHGALHDHRAWELQREVVAKGYRYISLDLRYYGSMPWPDNGSGYSFETHLADLAAFIRALDAGPVHLVGWSYGATLGLGLAAREPQLVRSAFLFEPSMSSVVTHPDELLTLQTESQGLAPMGEAARANENDRAIELLAAWLTTRKDGASSAPLPEWFMGMVRDNVRPLPLVFANMGRAPAQPVTCEELKRVRAPVAIVRGEQTRPFFRVFAEAAARCLPEARLLTIPEATHAGPVENPAAFNTTLVAFLEDHGR